MTRLLPLVLLVCAIALPATAGTYTTIEGIEYARVGSDAMQLDLRVPDGPGPWPVIVYLHSGAWITGDRSGGPIREAERGYAVANIDYPLAPAHVWPSQIEAAKAAVRWIRANAPRYGLDPGRIGAFGTSAGGHIAAVLGTSGGEASLEGLALGNPQYSSRVEAVVDLYGPSDLLKIDEQKLPCYGPVSANAWYMPPSLLIGCPIQECREKTLTSSPMSYITPDDPPFLLGHGQMDCLVPWQQSQLLYDALRAAGVPAELYVLPTAEHADPQFNAPQYQQILDAFLDRNLGGGNAQRTPRRRALRR